MSQGSRATLLNKELRKGPCLTEKDKLCSYCTVRGISFCGMVPDEDMAILSAHSRPLSLDRRKTLFHQGDEAENVYIVTSGALRLYQMLPDGRRQVIGFAVPGDLLGFPLSDHNEYSADALNSVFLCRFPRLDFLHILYQRSALLGALVSVVHDELMRSRQQLALISQKGADRKIAQFLLSFRGLQMRNEDDAALVSVRIPQADIADFLGLTIETVNRVLAKLTREKTIAVTDTGIALLDQSRLRALAEG
jgi:CRP/FNR family transcriptional regulator, anaerobic regulatory protein